MDREFELDAIILHCEAATQTKKGKAMRKFVIETKDLNYPQQLPCICFGDTCARLDGAEKNQDIKIKFSLKGREYQGKYYLNDLSVYHIELGQVAPPAPVQGDFPPSSIEDDNAPF